jgi:hypothetical protein
VFGGIINIVDLLFSIVVIEFVFITCKIVNFYSAVNRICACVNITGNFSKSSASASIHEFQILKVLFD